MEVHIDTDNEEWGRVCSDGKLIEAFEDGSALINAFTIRADIVVNSGDWELCGHIKE